MHLLMLDEVLLRAGKPQIASTTCATSMESAPSAWGGDLLGNPSSISCILRMLDDRAALHLQMHIDR
jgi:hypothetical protein